MGPRLLVGVSFVALTLGFLAGYGLRGIGERSGRVGDSGGPPGAPHPVGVEEFVRLGMRSLAAGDYDAAERSFREAVARSPGDPNPRVDLVVALMSQGRWGEADRELAEAKRLAPELPAVWLLEGWVARDGLADTARAERAWRRFLELAPAGSPQAEEVRRWLESERGEGEDGSSRG